MDADQRRELDLGRRNAQRRTPRYRSLVAHWLARLARRADRPSPSPLPPIGSGQVGVTYIGHASALIRYANLAIGCDPMLGEFIGAARREVAAGLSVAELGDIDLVLVSQAGGGHLHLPTLARLPRSATVVVPPRTAHLVSPLGFARLVELAVGQSLEHRRVDITAAAVRRGGEAAPALAYVIRGDGPSVFFCGDSGYFSGFADVGRRFRPDVALLPIGGYAPAAFRERHMSPLDALFAFEDLRARLLVPIRHGAFALSYELLHDPGRWLASLVAERGLSDHVLPLEPGESRVFSLPPDPRLVDFSLEPLEQVGAAAAMPLAEAAPADDDVTEPASPSPDHGRRG